jgi:hypothetical protein
LQAVTSRQRDLDSLIKAGANLKSADRHSGLPSRRHL